MNFRQFYFNVILGVLVLIIPGNKAGSVVSAQNLTLSEENPQFEIVYLGQIPDVNNEKKDNLFSRIFRKSYIKKNWFSELLFGSDLQNDLRPVSVLAYSKDSLLMLDQANGIIIKNQGEAGEIIHFKNSKNIRFPSLIGSCYLNREEILFTDSKLNQVFRLNLINNKINYLNKNIQLNNPTGIAYSAENDEIWIVETGAHRIQILDSNGNLLRFIGKNGIAEGEFNYPTYIWIDDSGTIYVMDTLNFRVQIFDKEGHYLSEFGEPGDVPGFFARPKGIATDQFGHIYVVDALFNNVQVFNREGRLLTFFGTRGNGSEEFWLPVDIYIDENNFIYVADSYNARVQMYKLRSTDQ